MVKTNSTHKDPLHLKYLSRNRLFLVFLLTWPAARGFAFDKYACEQERGIGKETGGYTLTVIGQKTDQMNPKQLFFYQTSKTCVLLYLKMRGWVLHHIKSYTNSGFANQMASEWE